MLSTLVDTGYMYEFYCQKVNFLLGISLEWSVFENIINVWIEVYIKKLLLVQLKLIHYCEYYEYATKRRFR